LRKKAWGGLRKEDVAPSANRLNTSGGKKSGKAGMGNNTFRLKGEQGEDRSKGGKNRLSTEVMPDGRRGGQKGVKKESKR